MTTDQIKAVCVYPYAKHYWCDVTCKDGSTYGYFAHEAPSAVNKYIRKAQNQIKQYNYTADRLEVTYTNERRVL